MNAPEARFAHVEQLLLELSHLNQPEAERITREVLSAVLELHERGLTRLLALATNEQRAAFASDPGVAALLLLHGLHPVPAETRARAALSALRTRFPPEILGFELLRREQALELQVTTKTGTCASRLAPLKQACESALLEAAPDLDVIRVTFAEPEPALVQLRLGATR